MQQKDVFIYNAIGIVNSIGTNLEDFNDGLKEGRNGASRLQDLPEEVKQHITLHKASQAKIANIIQHDPYELLRDHGIPKNQLRHRRQRVDRHGIWSMLSAKQALENTSIKDTSDVAIIIGSGNGGSLSREQTIEKLLIHELIQKGYIKKHGIKKLLETYKVKDSKHLTAGAFEVLKTIPNTNAGRISKEYNITGPSHTVNTACDSGNAGIELACLLIQGSKANGVILNTSEADMARSSGDSFSAMNAMSKSNEVDANRPCDTEASGFIAGEGSTTLILGDVAFGDKHKLTPYAKILGIHRATDGTSLYAPNIDLMQKTVEDFFRIYQLDLESFKSINAHLTSTKLGDPLEIELWARIFGMGHRIPITATKSMTGHTIANAASTEIVAAILGMRDNYVHGIINTQELHSIIKPFNMNIPLKKNLKHQNMLPLKQKRILKVSQGFGSHFSVLGLEKVT